MPLNTLLQELHLFGCQFLIILEERTEVGIEEGHTDD